MMETDKHDFNLIVITNILKRNNPIFKKPAELEKCLYNIPLYIISININ